MTPESVPCIWCDGTGRVPGMIEEMSDCRGCFGTGKFYPISTPSGKVVWMSMLPDLEERAASHEI